MTPHEFFATHPVFTAQEFGAAVASKRLATGNSSLLSYHEGQGHIRRLRRGLYISVPPGTISEQLSLDPFLVTAKFASDAVLAYHTALAFHGKAYSVRQIFTCLTTTASRPLRLEGYTFRPVSFPKALRQSGRTDIGVKTVDRAGMSVRVTSFDRTLVDVLDRLDLVGGWEEAWRSLSSVEFFNLDAVVEYATLLGNATTTAKVGLFLTEHRKALMVEESHLAKLRARRPRVPVYLERRQTRPSGETRVNAEWNLVVPRVLADGTWKEVA